MVRSNFNTKKNVLVDNLSFVEHNMNFYYLNTKTCIEEIIYQIPEEQEVHFGPILIHNNQRTLPCIHGQQISLKYAYTSQVICWKDCNKSAKLNYK